MFSLAEVLEYLLGQGTAYSERTIRTHVAAFMCVNAPDNHANTTRDLIRVGRGLYRLYDGTRDCCTNR